MSQKKSDWTKVKEVLVWLMFVAVLAGLVLLLFGTIASFLVDLVGLGVLKLCHWYAKGEEKEDLDEP